MPIGGVASAIHDRLEERLGPDSVFMDVDNVPLGQDFRRHIDAAIGRCDALIAIVGEKWVGGDASAGKRRIDDPRDFVRIEIEIALQKGIPVVPVLVGAAAMPTEEELPPPLREFAQKTLPTLKHHQSMSRELPAKKQ